MSDHPRERPILCLWGFMGTGKSTLGPLVAAQHHGRFVDLDALIEARKHQSIADIFATEGEAAFRALEREALEPLLVTPPPRPLLIALGGGALVHPQLRALALAHAYVVTLTATVADIIARTTGAQSRPLLAERSRDEVQALYTSRARAYADVHETVSTSERTPSEVAAHLSKRWQPRVSREP